MGDTFITKLHTWFSKDKKITFLTTLIVGMLVHFQLYSNNLLAYDGYWHYGSFLAKGWEVSLGRFFLPVMDLLRGTVVNSFLSSLISVMIISISSLILIDLLNIKKLHLKILTGILLAVTPTFSLTLMYPYTADSYTMAFLFAILSVWFLNKNFNLKNLLLSITCIVITLGFYQAYLCVIVTLLAIVYLINLLNNDNIIFKDFFKKFLYAIVSLLVGLITYYIIYVLIVNVLHLNITDYNGGSKILSIDTFKNLFSSIGVAYSTFYQFYFKSTIIENTEFVYRNILNVLMFLFIIANFIYIFIKNKIYKTPYKIIISLLILLLFPIFTCAIRLIAQAKEMDLLMCSALYLPIVLLIKQLDLINFKFLNLFSFIIVLLTIWGFILSDNATYIATNMYNKQMTAIGNRIVQRLEFRDDVYEDTPVCVLGKMPFNIQNSRLLNLTNFDVSNVNTWTWQVFLQDTLAFGRNICTYDSYDDILHSEDYLNMKAFPDEDSIKIINGIIVVKIGD